MKKSDDHWLVLFYILGIILASISPVLVKFFGALCWSVLMPECSLCIRVSDRLFWRDHVAPKCFFVALSKKNNCKRSLGWKCLVCLLSTCPSLCEDVRFHLSILRSWSSSVPTCILLLSTNKLHEKSYIVLQTSWRRACYNNHSLKWGNSMVSSSASRGLLSLGKIGFMQRVEMSDPSITKSCVHVLFAIRACMQNPVAGTTNIWSSACFSHQVYTKL